MSTATFFIFNYDPQKNMASAATAFSSSFLNAISTHSRGEEGAQYPHGRAAQIQVNKNASIFGRAFVSPDSWVYQGGPTIMNWIKCESKKAWLLKGQEGGVGGGEGAGCQLGW